MSSKAFSSFASDLSTSSGSITDWNLDMFCDDLRDDLVHYSKLAELSIPQSDYYAGKADAIAQVLRRLAVLYGFETCTRFFNESVWNA